MHPCTHANARVCNRRCDCLRGYSGPDCSQPPASINAICSKYGFHGDLNHNCSLHAPLSNCLNGCNRRGACMAGWCLCDKGIVPWFRDIDQALY